MKSELQRIETALQYLDVQAPPAPERPSAAVRGDRHSSTVRAFATPIEPPAPPPAAPATNAQLPPLPSGYGPSPAPSPLAVRPARQTLPFSRHQHGINPTLVTSLLSEMHATASGWQQELKQVLVDIQDIYLEGPIVEGWLESHRQSTDPQLVANVVQQYNSEPAARTGYRLCGWDEDGRVWSKYCPPDQVPSVSMAIARYQKLRQLLERKQVLEQQLSQLAETLIQTRSRMPD